MNPILIRHLYGSVRRKRFFWFLSFYLLSIGGLTLFFGLVIIIPESSNSAAISMLNIFTGGRTLYWFSGVTLLLTAHLLVPITALSAFAGERENRTLDLLVTTTLKARNIVLGKLTSAWVTGALYILAPFPLLMTGFWLGGVTTGELGITLLFLVLTMIVSIAWALFISVFVRRTIAAVLIFYGLTFALLPVILILGTALAALSEMWQYNNVIAMQPFWIEALIQYGWVLLAALHPLTAAIVTEAMIFEQDSWLLLHFTVQRTSLSTSTSILGSLTLPSPWITFTAFAIIATLILLRVTIWRLERLER
ncbi:MAG TPA: ABC transporter permease [Anaerolineae bacterium]|nr:ABC transporter permease [Anaerolineae bacterium]HQI85411.1 ABC transporter permease [Anaerolineae bacterium]